MKAKFISKLAEGQLSKRKRAEIQTFADRESYEQLMSRPYFVHLKQKINHELRNFSYKNKKILEIGAGRSDFLHLFEKDNDLTALDISPVLLSQNKTTAKLVVGDAENLPFPDQSFDFVYLVGVLHHLEDQKRALLEISRVLKNHGQVFISEPIKWSLNLPYYLVRRIAIFFLGEKKYQNMSGCGSPEESFVELKLVSETFNKNWQVRTKKQLPLRMPPVNFLEKIFSKRLNDFLEKTPIIKSFGSIVFIHAQKNQEESLDLGFGTEYEKFVLKKIAQKLCQKYQIQTSLKFPENKLLGTGDIFPISKKREKPTLVWNFCDFEQTVNTCGFIKKVTNRTDKYILIITQNYLNPGVLLHWLFHQVFRKKWDHGILSKMSSRAVLKSVKNNKNLEVLEIGAFDLPWFILDVYETGKYFRSLPFLRNSDCREMKVSIFENWPFVVKLVLGHHHFVFFKKR